jgi:phage protein D
LTAISTAQVIVALIDNDDGDEYNLTDFLKDRILSFKFEDKDKGKDWMKMELRNDDRVLLDAPVFQRGQKLLVTWGWAEEMQPPRRMIVTKAVGSNPVTVTAYCTSALLDREKKYRFVENITDSEFVREVAAEYGYTGTWAHIEETTIRHDITQPQWRTDASQIQRLARQNGMEFYIDAQGLHWHKRQTELDPVHTFIYRTDPGRGDILEEPQIEINLAKPTAKVKVLCRDPRTKEMIEEVSDSDELDMSSLGTEDEIGDPEATDAGRREQRLARLDVRNGGLMTREEAKAEANARYRETVKNRYKMTVPIIGRGNIGAKMLVDFWGISEMFDGLYYLKMVEHVVESGKFTQVLHCRKDAAREVKASRKKRRRKINPNAGMKEPNVESGKHLYELNHLSIGPDGDLQVVRTWTDSSNIPPSVGEQYQLPSTSDERYREFVELLAGEFGQSVAPDTTQ